MTDKKDEPRDNLIVIDQERVKVFMSKFIENYHKTKIIEKQIDLYKLIQTYTH